MTSTIESIICNGFATLVAISLFIFWTKKNALLNFRAWALLTAIINGLLAFNWISRWLNMTNVRFLMLLQFITTVVILYRLWLLSEKYIPRQKISKCNFRPIKVMKSRIMALSQAFKNGGNNKENINKIKQKIAKSL